MFVAMLRQLLCIIFLGISFLAFSDNGGEETIYLDERMKETKKKNAFYYCELTKTPDDTFSVKAYFLSGELKMEGKYLDEAMEIPHGSFVYYYESGKVEETFVTRPAVGQRRIPRRREIRNLATIR